MTTNTSRETIAATVRAEMARRRVDQSAIADLLGKAPSSVSDRLAAKTNFRIEELQAIAGLFGVSVAELLGETAAAS